MLSQRIALAVGSITLKQSRLTTNEFNRKLIMSRRRWQGLSDDIRRNVMNNLNKIFWSAVLGVLAGTMAAALLVSVSTTYGLLIIGSLGLLGAAIAGLRNENNEIVSVISLVAVCALLYFLFAKGVNASLPYSTLAGGLGGLAVHELLSGKFAGCVLGILGGSIGGLGAGFILLHLLPGVGLAAVVAGALTGAVSISVVIRYRSMVGGDDL
jgi:hypothetical protein